MRKKIYVVYRTVNVMTNEFYIGSYGIYSDGYQPWNMRSYLGSGKNLRAAVKRHGRASFKMFRLAVFPTKALAHEAEKKLIRIHYKDRLCLNRSQNQSYDQYVVLQEPLSLKRKRVLKDLEKYYLIDGFKKKRPTGKKRKSVFSATHQV